MKEEMCCQNCISMEKIDEHEKFICTNRHSEKYYQETKRFFTSPSKRFLLMPSIQYCDRFEENPSPLTLAAKRYKNEEL